MTKINREEWLTRAIKPLAKLLKDADVDGLRPIDPACVQVSVGWPGGKSVNKVIGQCWPTITASGVSQLFISPKLTKPTQVLDVLLHELIHAADDCEHGHKGIFVRATRAVGLDGKPTETFAGDELKIKLTEIAAKLGEYPHKGVTPGSKIKTQTTRMLKLECPDCGYVVRTTRKWLDEANPVCKNGHAPVFFEEAA